MTQPINEAAGISIRLVTALLGVRTSTAADPYATAEGENLAAVQVEIADFGDQRALVNMLGGMMAAAIEAIGRADDRDPLAVWQKAMVGVASDDVDE